MKRGTITRGELREQWETNVTPLITAVREGASHANHVGQREWARARRRARMRRYIQRWRLPWVAVAAALAVIGVMGGLRAARARRADLGPDLAAVRDEAKAGVRERMEAARERIGTAAARGTANPEPEPVSIRHDPPPPVTE